MREITPEELKEIQLQMMDYVDHFCRINDIQYTLACGTLIGAMRHEGFIPWDDDIDIHLLREEYNKFTRLWNEQKESHPYELVNIESGNNMGYPFGKIHDPKTVTYVGTFKRTGVFIDVFPMDFVVDEEDFRIRQAKIAKLYRMRDTYIHWINIRETGAPLLKKLYVYLRKPRISYNQLAIEISNIAQEIKQPTDFVYEMVCAVTLKHPVPASAYDEYIDCNFENRKYRIIKGYDQYLSILYGDWRTLPPVEKRVTHHGFKAYWKD